MGEPLIGYVGGFEFHSDTYTTVTNEAVGNASDTSFTLAHSDIDGLTAEVTVGGSALGDNYWNIKPSGSLVLTNVSSDAGDITATYDYCNKVVATGAFTNWSIDMSIDMQDVTNFDTVGWKENITGLKEWTGSAERHWQDGKVSKQHGNKALVRFYMNDSNNSDYYVGWAYVTGYGANVSIDAVVDESLEFTGIGELYCGW